MNDDATARVQKHYASLMQTRGVKPKWAIDAVVTAGRLLREVRNYGVHPRSTTQQIQRFFTESGCALLFLEATEYFVLLRASSLRCEDLRGGRIQDARGRELR